MDEDSPTYAQVHATGRFRDSPHHTAATPMPHTAPVLHIGLAPWPHAACRICLPLPDIPCSTTPVWEAPCIVVLTPPCTLATYRRTRTPTLPPTTKAASYCCVLLGLPLLCWSGSGGTVAPGDGAGRRHCSQVKAHTTGAQQQRWALSAKAMQGNLLVSRHGRHAPRGTVSPSLAEPARTPPCPMLFFKYLLSVATQLLACRPLERRFGYKQPGGPFAACPVTDGLLMLVSACQYLSQPTPAISMRCKCCFSAPATLKAILGPTPRHATTNY